jgi:hypothetical protein
VSEVCDKAPLIVAGLDDKKIGYVFVADGAFPGSRLHEALEFGLDEGELLGGSVM